MFKKVLVANRGEIAMRVIRACRELGIATVAVHSTADADAMHVRFADESVCIGPAPSRESYLNVPAILSAAEITRADAIHPGYGFLSENADFAEVCRKCGIHFIGPRPEMLRMMGNKVSARAVARESGLPLLPGSQGVIRTPEEAEALANEIVLQNAPVSTRLMSVDDAISEGAMAPFGEKYGDEVRVVSMGRAVRGEKAGKTYSLELCGGTHVRSTGDIGLVHVVAEWAVAAGVRRLEALTGAAARHYFEEQETRLKQAAAVLKVAPADVVSRVEALVDERRKLERELVETRRKLALGGREGGSSASEAREEVGGVAFMGRVVNGIAPKDLKPLADEGKRALGSGVVVFVGTSDDGKASVVVGVTDDLTERFSAVELVRAASAAIGGKGGGGRPDMAQAGGPDGAQAGAAIEAVKSVLSGS